MRCTNPETRKPAKLPSLKERNLSALQRMQFLSTFSTRCSAIGIDSIQHYLSIYSFIYVAYIQHYITSLPSYTSHNKQSTVVISMTTTSFSATTSKTQSYPIYAISELLDVYTSLANNNAITIDQEAAIRNSARADTLQVPPIVEFLASKYQEKQIDSGVQNVQNVQNIQNVQNVQNQQPQQAVNLDNSHTPDTTNATINSATTQQQQDYISPELTSWYYTDLSNNIQGPFSSVTMQNWYLQGHLNSDLQVRRDIDVTTVTIANLYKKCKSLSSFSPNIAPFNQPLPQSLTLPSLSAFNSTSSIFGTNNNSQFFNEQPESRANSSYLHTLNMLDSNLSMPGLPVNSNISSYSNMMNMGMGMGSGLNMNMNIGMNTNLGMDMNMPNINMPNMNLINNQNYSYGVNNNINSNMLDSYMQLNNINNMNSMSSSINSLAPLVNTLSLDENLMNLDSTTTSANGLGTPLLDTFDNHILPQTHQNHFSQKETQQVNHITSSMGTEVSSPEPKQISDNEKEKEQQFNIKPVVSHDVPISVSTPVSAPESTHTIPSTESDDKETKQKEKSKKLKSASQTAAKTPAKVSAPSAESNVATTIPSVDLTQHIKELEMEKKQKLKEEHKQRELLRQQQLMEERLAEQEKARVEQLKLKEQAKLVKKTTSPSSSSPAPAPWASVKKPITSFDEVQREEKEKSVKLAKMNSLTSSPATSAARVLADSTSDIAPWASATPKQPTKSIDEIQREEKERRQRELEERRKIEEADRLLASKLALEDLPTISIKGKKKVIPLSAITSSKPEAVALPSGTTWATVSQGASTSLKDIIAEQANALAEIKQKTVSQPSTSESSSNKQNESSWTVVSKEKPKTNSNPPPAQPVRNPAIVPSTVKSAVEPQSTYTPPAPKPVSLSYPPQAVELLTWARSQLKGLYPGVNKEDMLGMWLSFPVNEGQEIIADTIYSNSATMDGRRFASEFIKRRERVENLIRKRNWAFDWFDTIIGTANMKGTSGTAVSGSGDDDDWEGAFTVVKNKRRK